ncbi:hypothetical protein [Streptomyces sp. NPDC046759]|uniref:hypothetical protein n=1 Tax=Streptomyces sp. NPDC046759 TaxID=3155019 RepID=UPI0033D4723D
MVINLIYIVPCLLLRGVRRALAGPRGASTVEAEPEQVRERFGAHMTSIPECAYERQRRVGVRRGHSADETHPPTHLRRMCLLAGPATPAAVVADGERQRRIAAELAGARVTVARRILREGFDG